MPASIYARSVPDRFRRSCAKFPLIYDTLLIPGGKQGLFEAITSDTCETIFQGLTPEKLATRATDEVLKEVGTRYLAIVTSPTCLSLHRLVIAEAPRIPEVAQRFWKLGPGRSRAFLAEFFDRQIERGLLRMPNTESVLRKP
jgi:TetR/AcrR family transcriptional regulator, mexJK operon transcriptional repressor